MKNLRTIFFSCLGSCLGILLLGVLLFAFGTSAFVSSLQSEKAKTVDENSILHIEINGQTIVERSKKNLFDFRRMINNQYVSSNIGLFSFKRTIEKAKKDDNIEGIYLDFKQSLASGMVSIQEIRQSLLDFKSSGKWLVASGTNFSQQDYHLASVANKIYLNPEGSVSFTGFAARIMFYKRMLDKMGVKATVFRVGDYKSAVEPYIRESMSAESRAQITSLVNNLYENMLNNISLARNISKDSLRMIADDAKIRFGGDALRYGFVDALYYEDQVHDDIRGRLELEEDDEIEMTNYYDYEVKNKSEESQVNDNEIAVVILDGIIVQGASSQEQGRVGSETIVEALRKVRKDGDVKAVVLRINSPGGSSLASDEMWREISLLAKEKPVVASMSNLAASGGYYVAVACDVIVAQPSTITGSIGVFGLMLDVSELANDKIGITTDQVTTGKMTSPNLFYPLTNIQKEVYQEQVDSVYEVFVNKVVKGRKMSKKQVKAIASGRVWTGAQAKERNLVDVLGDYDSAIAIAAKRVNITDYKVRRYPHIKNFMEEVIEEIQKEVKMSMLRRDLGSWYPAYHFMRDLETHQGIQARIPYIEISGIHNRLVSQSTFIPQSFSIE